MRSAPSGITPQKIEAYFSTRVQNILTTEEADAICRFLVHLLKIHALPPYRSRSIDCAAIAAGTDVAEVKISQARHQLRPVFDAVWRALTAISAPPYSSQYRSPVPNRGRKDSTLKDADAASSSPQQTLPRKKRGPSARPINEFPAPLWISYDDPDNFSAALRLQIKRHGDTIYHLHRCIIRQDEGFDRHTIRHWCDETRSPQSIQSLDILKRIEQRYRLPEGYFKAKLSQIVRAPRGHLLDDLSPSETRRLAWHLPDNFNYLSITEQEEILNWVRTVIISGSTDYRRYQAAAMRHRFAVRFRSIQGGKSKSIIIDDDDSEDSDFEVKSSSIDAPAQLEAEMANLLRFKTSTLTALGFQRNGVWNTETASQRIEHFSLLFGAFSASPKGIIHGYGAKLEHLTFAMLIFPVVWDWYLQWREKKRGFYTRWEVDMLTLGVAFTRKDTGWLRQSPELANNLRPIPGLISETDIATARENWDAACEKFILHAKHRIKEIDRVARVHRDPFEPILPILEASSPVGEYNKIAAEILRLMPDERRYPKAAAESSRAFLLIRFGLHLGLRQKNLRELLLCPREKPPTLERHLQDMRRGEVRWSERDHGWEVLIPSIAFKNAHSSFFGAKPFRLVLPDIGGLYDAIDSYITRHRSRLIGMARDPGTFFVKTTKKTSADAAYDQNTFYEAWRLTIQRYGIYNPYTGRGVIKGLLPHGPHNVRDVLATHILKQTGSYEQASYAIQDTPEMVAKHYGRFLPQDKAAIAAQILNKVWAAA